MTVTAVWSMSLALSMRVLTAGSYQSKGSPTDGVGTVQASCSTHRGVSAVPCKGSGSVLAVFASLQVRLRASMPHSCRRPHEACEQACCPEL